MEGEDRGLGDGRLKRNRSVPIYCQALPGTLDTLRESTLNLKMFVIRVKQSKTLGSVHMKRNKLVVSFSIDILSCPELVYLSQRLIFWYEYE